MAVASRRATGLDIGALRRRRRLRGGHGASDTYCILPVSSSFHKEIIIFTILSEGLTLVGFLTLLFSIQHCAIYRGGLIHHVISFPDNIMEERVGRVMYLFLVLSSTGRE